MKCMAIVQKIALLSFFIKNLSENVRNRIEKAGDYTIKL
jgi:hypothetical protein